MIHRFAILLALASAPALSQSSAARLVEAAKSQIGVTVRYDASYQRLRYPGGDVPIDRGVCTDVVIRAYRQLGIDLQELVHRDIATAWNEYPRNWQLTAPDSNIDHRRVPNLRVFFKRHGVTIPLSRDAGTYLPGDIVIWRLTPALPHIGIVSDRKSPTGIPLVIHNIGAGAQSEDILFRYTITGHFRWLPAGADPRSPRNRVQRPRAG